MKYAEQIVKWGKIKPFFDKSYHFNTIDIETIDNELFMFGYTLNKQHHVSFNNFYNKLHDMIIDSIQAKKDILTWSRYDNTHLLKLILKNASKKDIKNILLRVGKVSPIYTYTYKTFTFVIENIIKDSIIIKVIDLNESKRTIILYNLKNLYSTDLLTTAQNYGFDYYSKMGI